MRRASLAAFILTCWVGSLAWLAWREFGPGHSDQFEGLDERLPPGDAFLALRLGDEQVGIVSSVLDTVAGGARTVERLDLLARGADTAWRRTLSTEGIFGPGPFERSITSPTRPRSCAATSGSRPISTSYRTTPSE